MSRKLFTKLHQGNFKTHSEQQVHSLVENIIERTNQTIRIHTIQKNSTKILASQIMRLQMLGTDQAYISAPCSPRLTEDMGACTRIMEPTRPFSTKIQYHHTSLPSSKKSLYSHPRSSSRMSKNMSFSYPNKNERRRGFARPVPKKFVPLQTGEEQVDEFQQNEENARRIKKVQEMAYYKSLQEFQTRAKNESDKNAKINIKIAQLMGNKTFYYNRNGDNIEIAPKKLLKKVANKRHIRKSQNIKRQVGLNTSESMGYNSSESLFKKTRETVKLDDKPAQLFYKSQNCKYQIIPI